MPLLGISIPRPAAFSNALSVLGSACTTESRADGSASSSAAHGLAALQPTDIIERSSQESSFFNAELASYTDDQWKKAMSVGDGDDRITLSRVSQPVSALPVSPVQVKTIVHAPLDKVLAVFMGAERNMEWSDAKKIKAFEVKQNNHKDRCEMYVRLRGAFPLVDRDYYIDSRIRVFPEQRMVESVAVNIADRPTSDAVRMKRLEIRWVMKALGPDTTEVTHQSLSDPGGSLSMVPASIIDRFTQELPLEMLAAFRNQALNAEGYEDDQARMRALWPELFARI